MIVVDIKPYWKNLTNWYWSTENNRGGFSIQEILEQDYGAHRVGPVLGNAMLVKFPDEQTHTWFVLRWS